MAAHELDREAFAAQERLNFFHTMRAGFDRAGSTLVERHIQIGSFHITLRFAGDGLLSCILPAFEHIVVDPNVADLTVHLFDSNTTNMPLPLWAQSLVDSLRHGWAELLGPRHEIKAYTDDRIFAIFYPHNHILCLVDRETNQAVYWVNSASEFPYWERAYPLASLLNAWLSDRAYYFVHAAAVGTDAGTVLLANKGGSGKSTTTIASALAGMLMLGDDYCAVAIDDNGGVAHSLYNSIKIEPEGNVIRNFPELEPYIINWEGFSTGEEKAVVFINQHRPELMRRQMPIRAILIPHISGQPKTTITNAPRAAALRALAPNTMLQLAGNSRRTFHWLGQLVRNVPAYHLALGTEINQVPVSLQNFLAQFETG
ncbi:serine kinase [Pseudomonadota bacterium]